LIAVDIQPVDDAPGLSSGAAGGGVTNVETHVASAHCLPLATGAWTGPFSITVLPEIPDRARALAELRRVLDWPAGGVLSITEEFYDPDYLFLTETVRLVEAAGFRLEERFGNWAVYTANFRRVAEDEGSTFQDKVVIVTGASSGIGKAVALRLASAGALASLAAPKRRERLEELRRPSAAPGRRCRGGARPMSATRRNVAT